MSRAKRARSAARGHRRSRCRWRRRSQGRTGSRRADGSLFSRRLLFPPRNARRPARCRARRSELFANQLDPCAGPGRSGARRHELRVLGDGAVPAHLPCHSHRRHSRLPFERGPSGTADQGSHRRPRRPRPPAQPRHRFRGFRARRLYGDWPAPTRQAAALQRRRHGGALERRSPASAARCARARAGIGNRRHAGRRSSRARRQQRQRDGAGARRRRPAAGRPQRT